MSRISKKKREKRPGLESWLKWHTNAFSIFPSTSNPWGLEDAKAFYAQHKEEIHNTVGETDRKEYLQAWIAENGAQ